MGGGPFLAPPPWPAEGRSRGDTTKTARALGITERMMGLWVARYGIDPGQFK